jgi:predicted alpha/beta hydrolase family esterase
MHETPQPHDATPRCVLLVPGIGNSGPTHWQSYWEAEHDGYTRVQQNDWDHPVCADWVDALELAAQRAGPGALIAAHSLGCLVVASWLARTSIRIAGALLVAVPDPSGASFPSEAKGFHPVPPGPLPCPSLVVASSDDPYSDIAFATQCADAWGSRLINIGQAGHINAASGLGRWDEGQRLLRSLLVEA